MTKIKAAGTASFDTRNPKIDFAYRVAKSHAASFATRSAIANTGIDSDACALVAAILNQWANVQADLIRSGVLDADQLPTSHLPAAGDVLCTLERKALAAFGLQVGDLILNA